MADFTTPASNAGSMQDNAFPIKPVLAVALAALADWLFYGERIGISVVIFAVALACGSLLANFARLDGRKVTLAGILVLAGLLPAVEEFNFASLFFIAPALGVSLVLTTNRSLDSQGEQAAALCDLFLIGPFRLLGDAAGMFKFPTLMAGFTVWFVPVVLGAVFAFLFASANPLIAKWISLINPGDASSYTSMSRALFWIAAMSIVWPFVHVWWRGKRTDP